MDNYSFLGHVNTRLADFFTKYNFSLDKSSSSISSGYKNNLLFFKSHQLQMKIYAEHNRIGIEVSSLTVGRYDPNLWYAVDLMACFVSKTHPKEWFYDLPRGVILNQVMEQQLTRLKMILTIYFDEIAPFFASKETILEMQEILDSFVRFYNSQYTLTHSY